MKEKIKQFKEFYKKPKSKAILFLSFYFVFFTVLILLMRYGNRRQILTVDYEKSSSVDYKIDNIRNKNFLYVYNVIIDDIKYEYYGEKNGDSEYFAIDDTKYLKKSDKYYINNNGTWIECDNPYVFYYFLNIDNVLELIKSSYYDSETTYKSGKINYNFLISTNTINKLVLNIDTDYYDELNQVVLVSNKDKEIDEIDFVLDDFCSRNSLCNHSLKVQLMFDEFGEIEQINK